ncbi:hypothetical protein [Streptomyces lavendulae]|uniref:hypothetical protein n=1 Tax=Streptomyces lavendulae TaxID=1914 RepID=UPI0033C18A7D
MTHRIEVSDMSVPGRAAGPLLLDYTLSTVPARLRVSTATQDRLGRLDLTVTGGTTASPYYCEQITITLPIGPGPTQLTEAGLGVIAREVTGGSGGNQGRGWDITETPGNTRRTFTCTPRHEARFDGTWTLKLSLIDIPLNRQPGDAPITIAESTRTTDGDYETREETVPITKSPPEFIFTDFRPENIAVPRTQAVKLHWVCDGDADATFTLFWNGNTEAIGKGVRQWPPAGRTVTITKDTSFMLRANTKNPSGGDEYHYQTIVINCTDPDLTANTLNVTNTSNLSDTNIAPDRFLKVNEIHANGGAYGVHIDADLQLKGKLGRWGGGGSIDFFNTGLTVTGGDINLHGTTNTRDLTVNSNNTLKASKLESSGWAYGIHVNSSLQISGFLNGYSNTPIAIDNGLSVAGTFTANGPVDLFKGTMAILQATVVGTWSFTAPTSGLASATVTVASGEAGHATADVWGNGAHALANLRQAGNQTGTIAVSKGTVVYIRHTRWSGRSTSVFTWTPMGTSQTPGYTPAVFPLDGPPIDIPVPSADE